MQKYKSGAMELERKIGPNGEIVIPEEFRKEVGIKPEINVRIGIKNHEIFIRKEEDFIEWLRDRAKKYGRDMSKVNLKEVYESQFEEKWEH